MEGTLHRLPPPEIANLPDQEMKDRIHAIIADPAIVSLYGKAKQLPLWAAIGGLVGYSASVLLSKRYSKMAQLAKEHPFIYKFGKWSACSFIVTFRICGVLWECSLPIGTLQSQSDDKEAGYVDGWKISRGNTIIC